MLTVCDGYSLELMQFSNDMTVHPSERGPCSPKNKIAVLLKEIVLIFLRGLTHVHSRRQFVFSRSFAREGVLIQQIK